MREYMSSDTGDSATEPLHLYWQTGCTSCLRAKEFLERNEVEFESHNIIQNEALKADMVAKGLPERVPIVQRGDEWVDAQILDNVARIAGVEHETDPLPIPELESRLTTILEATQRFVDQIPDDALTMDIPNRPRSHGELIYHIFSLPETFLEHEDGAMITSYKPEPAWANRSKRALTTYGANIQARLDDYFEGPGQSRDWSTTANVYYGEPTVHQFLERTTWHAGQHARQLQWLLREVHGQEVDQPLGDAVREGLPMPDKIWDAM